ncbi:MAG: hypothetical protein LBR22_10600 [Desulfovibrio sp.]|jgi:hypothetical protein|nr:hypothetical protein [Desulfovibrio sp.]
MDRTIEERVGDLERTQDIQAAVKAAMKGVSKEIRKAAYRSEKASQEAAYRSERASQENARETRNSRWWIIATILAALAIGMTAMYHETNKSWNMALKAYEQSVQTMARLDATLDRTFRAQSPAPTKTPASYAE